jgi:hypothetical protein
MSVANADIAFLKHALIGFYGVEQAVRIVMISDIFYPRINGVSTSIEIFRRKFIEEGREVTLIAPDYGQSESESGSIIRVPSRYLFLDPEDRIMKMISITELTATLKMLSFDVLHVQTPVVAH